MKKLILSMSMLLFSTIIFAQDEALTVDANGNVGINNSNPQAALDVNGDVNVTGTVFTKSIASLRASSIIEVNSGHSDVSVGGGWVDIESGQFVYNGGALIFMINYSLYSYNGLVFADSRLKLTNSSTGEEIYLPDDAGWVHHSNETVTHHHKSLDLYRANLPSAGTWNVTFQVNKDGTRAPNTYIYFNGDDTMHVVVLELPNNN